MRTRRFITLLMLLLTFRGTPQERDALLDSIFRADTTNLSKVLGNPATYGVQVLYTRIDRSAAGVPYFTTHSWRVSDSNYFYPASTVKLPACLLALEKLNRLNVAGVGKNTPVSFDSAFAGQRVTRADPSAPGGIPTIGHYIKKVLLVSDNDAYNRLYEFLGQDLLNTSLAGKGYLGVNLITRLSAALTAEQNRHTNPVTFYAGNKVLLHLPGAFAPVQRFNAGTNLLQGSGYYRGNELINSPMDFTLKNAFPLRQQHNMLRAIFFPETLPAKERFQLTDDDYAFIRSYMGMFPRESEFPPYAPYTEYWDSYVKFFLFGDNKDSLSGDIRVYNKVGTAYGYLIDNAYIADYTHNVDFMLSAVIYCNADGIFNDDRYEYDSIGFPFLAALGKAVHRYELGRQRTHTVTLPRFTPNN